MTKTKIDGVVCGVGAVGCTNDDGLEKKSAAAAEDLKAKIALTVAAKKAFDDKVADWVEPLKTRAAEVAKVALEEDKVAKGWADLKAKEAAVVVSLGLEAAARAAMLKAVVACKSA